MVAILYYKMQDIPVIIIKILYIINVALLVSHIMVINIIILCLSDELEKKYCILYLPKIYHMCFMFTIDWYLKTY